MYSKHFIIQELVPEVIYKTFGDRAWWFVNPTIIAIVDALREDLGSALFANNWHRGGRIQNRGYRTPQTTVGAKYSQHKLGCAIDVSSDDFTPQQILDLIRLKKDKYLALGLTTIEDPKDTPTWIHLDCRPRISGIHPVGDFLIVKP